MATHLGQLGSFTKRTRIGVGFRSPLGVERSGVWVFIARRPRGGLRMAASPGDFRAALVSALECGGDTDTVGAIVGALAGVNVGKQGIPIEWLDTICEWPRSRLVMEQIAARLATQKTIGQPCGPVHYFWPGLLPRNLLFLTTVLVHGFHRLLPPY